MNRRKLWILILLAATVVICTLTVFALNESTPVVTTQPCPKGKDQARNLGPFPNDTVPKGPEIPITLPWNFSLGINEIRVSKGGSRNVTVTICSSQRVDLSLSIGLTRLPDCALPAGIEARFDNMATNVEANSKTTVNLQLSIDSQAPSGTYDLDIEVDQRFGDWIAGQSLPLQLIIP
jgi:hypothetical protein